MAIERKPADGERAPLALDLLGANQRLRDTLAMVFHGPAKARCALAQDHHADAVIINLDGVGAEAEWTRYRALHPDRPAIVLSLNGAPIAEAVAVVTKPVRIEQFLAALDTVEAQLRTAGRCALPESEIEPHGMTVATPAASDAETSSQDKSNADAPTEVLGERPLSVSSSTSSADPWLAVCGDAVDCDMDDVTARDQRLCRHDTALIDALYAALTHAHGHSTLVDVRLREVTIVRLDVHEQRAHCGLSEQALRALCAASSARGQISIHPATGGAPEGEVSSIEALLWKTALWTYRGQLPLDTPFDTRLYLAHWPNLTRLLPAPNACRIAALLVRHPMHLDRVAEALAIPQRHVFAFYGAAAAIGLMGAARREVDRLVAQEAPVADSRRALLRRLARRLALDGALLDKPS